MKNKSIKYLMIIMLLPIFILYVASYTYSECIKGDCYNGEGVRTWPDGGKYVGEFKDGKFNGQGTLIGANGEKYEGNYKNGNANGLGVHTLPNGEKYIGDIRDNEYNGQGIYTWPDGEKYEGEFKNNKSEGRGTITHADGSKYVGEWKDDKQHGQGTMIFSSGNLISGIWENNELVKLLPPATTGSEKPNGAIEAAGSGFLLTKSGLVVTNYHVIEDTTSYKVIFPSKNIVKSATVKMKDRSNDIAILKIDNFNLSYITPNQIPYNLAKSNSVKSGQDVFTLGFPFGQALGSTARLSTGVVNSPFGIDDDPSQFQISNPIQPGNSGSPLFNQNGELVGIVVQSLDGKYVYENMGVIPQNVNFAIKIEYLDNLIGMLPEKKEIKNRPNLLAGMSLEKQVEMLTPYVVTIQAK